MGRVIIGFEIDDVCGMDGFRFTGSGILFTVIRDGADRDTC